MASFIAAPWAETAFPAAVACRALGVSRSWYYKWASGRLLPRAERREQLKAEVKRLFDEHEGKAGSPRITADLRDAGWRVSESTVAKLMAAQHLAARPGAVACGVPEVGLTCELQQCAEGALRIPPTPSRRTDKTLRGARSPLGPRAAAMRQRQRGR